MCLRCVSLFYTRLCRRPTFITTSQQAISLFDSLLDFPHKFFAFPIINPLNFSNFPCRSLEHVQIKNTLNDHRKKMCNTDRATFLRATTPKNWRLRDSVKKLRSEFNNDSKRVWPCPVLRACWVTFLARTRCFVFELAATCNIAHWTSTGNWKDFEPFTFLNASDIKYEHDAMDLNKFQQVEKK